MNRKNAITQPKNTISSAFKLGRPEMLLFLAGLNLILLNFILVQHISVAIWQAEIAIILFSLAYFSGVSLGIHLSDKLSKRLICLTLPLFLIAQLGILLFSQSAIYVLNSHLTSTASYITIFLILMLFSTSLYSVFLPMLIDQEGMNLKKSYSIEILGSLIGLLLIPFLAGLSHEALLLGYFLSFIGISILLKMNKFVLFLLVIIAATFLLNFEEWDHKQSAWFYRHFYPLKNIEKTIYTKYSPYHKIDVTKSKEGELMLLLNGKRQFVTGSQDTYSYFVAEYPARLLPSPNVCVLGCGSMSTVGRIGNYSPAITIVDLDENVFKTSRKFFQQFNHIDELNNWTFTADDAKHFLANDKRQFDLILHDIPPGRSRQTALTYTAEFFELVKKRLTPNGIFSISALSVDDPNSTYGQKMIATLAHTFDTYFALEHEGSIYFYGGGPELKFVAQDQLISAIKNIDKEHVYFMSQSEIDHMIEGVDIITINNVGDLIFG